MKKFKSFFAFALMFAAVAVVMPSCSDDDDDDVTITNSVPSKFSEALKAQFPDATNVKWEKKTNYMVAEFSKDMTGYDVWYDQSASWAMTEMDYGKDLFLIPDNAVATAFAEGDYGTWTVDDITHYKQKTNEFYVFEVEKTGQSDMDVFYATDGTMLKAIASDTSADILPDTAI